MGWRIDVTPGSLQLVEVDHFVLAVDRSFPNSQIRILAPSAGNDYRWPHVEQEGLLCLRATRCAASIVDRIACHLKDAEDLLNYSEAKQREEFEREFVAYWSHRATNSSDRARVLTLVAPNKNTREVFYFYDAKNDRYVIGDEKKTLVKWLRNVGANPSNKEIFSTWLFRLSRPWIPKDFPELGSDITKLLPPEMIRKCLTPGMRQPFLFEVKTMTGAAFAAVVLRGGEYREVLKGFRHVSRVPTDRILGSYANRKVERCKVSRVDGAWIHGRDHSPDYAEIKDRKVAIIGCGSIGAGIARLLAQAGVGEIMLVDGDSLSPPNVSRHSLGISDVGFNKALALQRELGSQFPHLTVDHAFERRFEYLTSIELSHLARADLIVAAGIDFDGESTLDTWRRTIPQPPIYLSTWVEAYAVAGHAVLLYGNKSILQDFDEEERPNFRLTDWPAGSGALIVEAGCGNSFQPHGVVDLHPTIGLAAGLALEAFRGSAPISCRRVWMGNPSVVEKNGGILKAGFTDTLTVREFSLP